MLVFSADFPPDTKSRRKRTKTVDAAGSYTQMEAAGWNPARFHSERGETLHLCKNHSVFKENEWKQKNCKRFRFVCVVFRHSDVFLHHLLVKITKFEKFCENSWQYIHNIYDRFYEMLCILHNAVHFLLFGGNLYELFSTRTSAKSTGLSWTRQGTPARKRRSRATLTRFGRRPSRILTRALRPGKAEGKNRDNWAAKCGRKED